MPTAEIITIGTEILLGEIVDTNTRLIALTLRDLGIDLYRTLTIGDNVERIASALQASVLHGDIVITTGGLGPTIDDPTREAVARAFALEPEFREDLWEQVISAVARYDRKPSENQKRQAVVPGGAIAVPNPVGTAPGFIVETNACAIISLPGVPNEMEHMLQESVVPYLQRRFPGLPRIRVRILHCAGLGEGSIDEKIGDLERLVNPTVGLAAHTGVVDVRIAAKADTDERAAQLISKVEQKVRERLGASVFGADDDRLDEVAMAAASSRGWSVVGLEYGTHGMLAASLPRTVVSSAPAPVDLAAAAEAARREAGADVAVALSVDESTRAADVAVITPRGQHSKRLAYGGPPRSLARWATNLALNWLRTLSSESP